MTQREPTVEEQGQDEKPENSDSRRNHNEASETADLGDIESELENGEDESGLTLEETFNRTLSPREGELFDGELPAQLGEAERARDANRTHQRGRETLHGGKIAGEFIAYTGTLSAAGGSPELGGVITLGGLVTYAAARYVMGDRKNEMEDNMPYKRVLEESDRVPGDTDRRKVYSLFDRTEWSVYRGPLTSSIPNTDTLDDDTPILVKGDTAKELLHQDLEEIDGDADPELMITTLDSSISGRPIGENFAPMYNRDAEDPEKKFEFGLRITLLKEDGIRSEYYISGSSEDLESNQIDREDHYRFLDSGENRVARGFPEPQERRGITSGVYNVVKDRVSRSFLGD